jgi:hypothetical protein
MSEQIYFALAALALFDNLDFEPTRETPAKNREIIRCVSQF